VSSRGESGGFSADAGGRTAAEGTPFAVDVSGDRRARSTWAVFLAGPVTWFIHFMVVYLAVEAGCTGEGRGLRLLNPPVSDIVTLAATAVAATACLGFAGWAYRRWRASAPEPAAKEGGDLSGESGESEIRDLGGSLAFAGVLLSLLSVVAILFVGLPALVLPAC
jgi:hypothetical protein